MFTNKKTTWRILKHFTIRSLLNFNILYLKSALAMNVNNLQHNLDTIFFVRSKKKQEHKTKTTKKKRIQHYAQVVYHLQFDRRVHKIYTISSSSLLCKMHWLQPIYIYK